MRETAKTQFDELTRQVNALALEVRGFTAAQPPTLELMNTNIAATRTAVENVVNRLNEQNGRVRRLEVWRGSIVGGLVILSLLGGWFIRDAVTKASEVYSFMLQHQASSSEPREVRP
jgi:hypothetical protein